MRHFATKQVPRYTSYPTAPHFHALSSTTHSSWLANLKSDEPISLYVHIPFCEQLCWYCGCNTKITSKYTPIQNYVQKMLMEINKVADTLPNKKRVSHVSWGGGTPTKLQSSDFKEISDLLHEKFDILDDAEINVEIDPRTLTQDMVETLSECDMNRVSFGVQDFDENVQKAINRIQPFELTAKVVGWLRDAGVTSVNFDLIYGLPLQNEKTILDTVEKTKQLMPNRIALFGYAHVPWMKKHQKLLEKHHLPTTDERIVMANIASTALEEIGYVKVGLDHFALKDDPMAIHWKDGTIKRNFQGYTVDDAETLIAFGASSISKLPQGYIQNHTSVKDYADGVETEGLAPSKGIELSIEDNKRAHMILDLMCKLSLDLSEYPHHNNWGDEKILLQELHDEGLIGLNDNEITVTTKGQPLVRVVASVFDEYLEHGTAKHSVAV